MGACTQLALAGVLARACSILAGRAPLPLPACLLLAHTLPPLAPPCAETFFCVVDLHAITAPHDPVDLRTSTRTMAATYMAAGIDPARSNIFVQVGVAAAAWLAEVQGTRRRECPQWWASGGLGTQLQLLAAG